MENEEAKEHKRICQDKMRHPILLAWSEIDLIYTHLSVSNQLSRPKSQYSESSFKALGPG
ncbi:hypothetical protein AAZX31_13G237000 [Glycine max]|nr:hypothetical protein GYH30_037358 [Glycine max]